ncbi:unnamed protein product, partial [Iphiclides podalirius]
MFGIRTPAKRPNELDRESSPNERAMAGPSRVRRSIGEWEAENQDLDPGAQNKKTNQAQTRGVKKPKNLKTTWHVVAEGDKKSTNQLDENLRDTKTFHRTPPAAAADTWKQRY